MLLTAKRRPVFFSVSQCVIRSEPISTIACFSSLTGGIRLFYTTVVTNWPVVSGSNPRSTLIAANLASTVLHGLAAEARKRVVPLFQIKKRGLRPLLVLLLV